MDCKYGVFVVNKKIQTLNMFWVLEVRKMEKIKNGPLGKKLIEISLKLLSSPISETIIFSWVNFASSLEILFDFYSKSSLIIVFAPITHNVSDKELDIYEK
jgi:hypothetical protein